MLTTIAAGPVTAITGAPALAQGYPTAPEGSVHTLYLSIVTLLAVLGSYALGLSVTNPYLMVAIGVVAYVLTELDYPARGYSAAVR